MCACSIKVQLFLKNFDIFAIFADDKKRYFEYSVHHIWTHLSDIGSTRRIPARASDHAIPAAVRLSLPERQQKTVRLADEPSASGKLYQELHGTQGHTATRKDRFCLHTVAYSALLRNLRCRTLGNERIIHTDSYLCDSAYPVIQDPEVNHQET